MKLIALMFLVVFIGCNKKEEAVSTPTTPPVAGTYELCQSEDGVSAKMKVLLNENSIVGSLTVYGTTNCTSGQELFNERDIYSYTHTGTSYSLTLESVVVTVLDATMATSFNSNSFCQYTDWSNGVPKRLIGQVCDGATVTAGTQSTVTMYKKSTSLGMIENGVKTIYARVKELSLASAGQTLADGTYVYFDGTRGVHLDIATPNFQMILYDEATHRYYTKNGTFTSANNEAQLSAVVNTPDCATDEGTPVTRKFVTSSYSLGIESLETNTWLLEKVTFTPTQFRDTYLGAGYVAQCF